MELTIKPEKYYKCEDGKIRKAMFRKKAYANGEPPYTEYWHLTDKNNIRLMYDDNGKCVEYGYHADILEEYNI